MAALPLHVQQHVAAGAAGGRHGQGAHRQGVTGGEFEQVKGVDHADHLVERAAIHRQPTVAALHERRPDLLDGGLLGYRHQLGARSHHLTHHPLGKADYSTDPQQLVVGTDSGGGALAPEGGHVGLRPRLRGR